MGSVTVFRELFRKCSKHWNVNTKQLLTHNTIQPATNSLCDDPGRSHRRLVEFVAKWALANVVKNFCYAWYGEKFGRRSLFFSCDTHNSISAAWIFKRFFLFESYKHGNVPFLRKLFSRSTRSTVAIDRIDRLRFWAKLATFLGPYLENHNS